MRLPAIRKIGRIFLRHDSVRANSCDWHLLRRDPDQVHTDTA